MASISTRKNNGRVRVCFMHNGKRRTIRLGTVSPAFADRYRSMVEHFLACINATEPASQEAIRWASSLSDPMYARLAHAGVLPPRDATRSQATIGELVKDLNAEQIAKKPFTRGNYAHIFGMMEAYFGKDRIVDTITAKDADTFILWARTVKKNAPATVSRRIKAWRLAFTRAVRWEMAEQNPFAGIRAGSSINHARKAFVPAETVDALIDATSNIDLRCVLALSRYGALRCPSEIVTLRWCDVRWDDGKLIVYSPKTEHHKGGESRVMPLFKPLRDVLLAAFEAAPDGSEFVLQSRRSPGVNLRTKLTKLMRRTGTKRWPKLFQNMRASRESELYRLYPLPTVCQWLGHTPEVAAAHYLIDTDKDATFQAAADLDEKATRNATRARGESGEIEGKLKEAKTLKTTEKTEFAGVLASSHCARRDSKTRANASNPARSGQSAPKSDALSNLGRAIQAWELLNALERKAFLKIAGTR